MHHATLYVGDLEGVLTELLSSVPPDSPDVRIYRADRLGIDEARMMIAEAATKPVREAHRTFFIACKSLTLEAQNALLKLLEEPPAGAVFNIIVPHEEVLIATVRSRMAQESPITASSVPQSQGFLKLSYSERLSAVAKAAKDGDLAWFEDVLREIEHAADRTKNRTLMREVLMVRGYIDAPGASKKMLLEHLALIA
jgi:hypothetical protein